MHTHTDIYTYTPIVNFGDHGRMLYSVVKRAFSRRTQELLVPLKSTLSCHQYSYNSDKASTVAAHKSNRKSREKRKEKD